MEPITISLFLRKDIEGVLQEYPWADNYSHSNFLSPYFNTLLETCHSKWVCNEILTLQLFKASALWADALYKSKCPSVCLSVFLCVCLFVCPFTFEVPFNGIFVPTSQSRMSNIFRDSESLGKSNGKKWSII